MSALRGPGLLLVPVAALFAAWFWLGRGAQVPPATDAPEVSDATELIEIWAGQLLGPKGEPFEARLLPLHGESAWAGFDQEVLRQRYGLPSGGPFRLEFTGQGADAAHLLRAEVSDDGGQALVPFGELMSTPIAKLPAKSGGDSSAEPELSGTVLQDPLASLLARGAGGRSAPAAAILWGRPPAEGAQLDVEWDLDGKNAPVLASTSLLREELPCGELPRHLWQLTSDELQALRSPSDG